MAREFKETAHLNTDLKKYSDNYDRIFKKNVLTVPKMPEFKVPPSPEEVEKLISDNKEMRDILLDMASKTHQNKKLYDWYCRNGGK